MQDSAGGVTDCLFQTARLLKKSLRLLAVVAVAMILLLPVWLELKGIWYAVVFAEILSLFVSIAFLLAKRKKYGYMA